MKKLKKIKPLVLSALLLVGATQCDNSFSPKPTQTPNPVENPGTTPTDPQLPDDPSTPPTSRIPIPNDQNLSARSMSYFNDFISSLPPIQWSDLDNVSPDVKLQIQNNYKDLFVKIVKHDPQYKKMGFSSDRVQKYVMPRIADLRMAKTSTYGMSGAYFHDTGTMNINTNADNIDIIRALIHEDSHVFNYGEHAAELYTEVLTGVKSVRDRSDWWYGPYALRPIYELMKQEGQEARFWDSLSYDDGVKAIWNKYSPHQTIDNQSVPIMSFDEWQNIRQIPGTGNQGLKQLSLDLDKAYDVTDPAFIQMFRAEITTYSDMGKRIMDNIIASYGGIANTPADAFLGASLQASALVKGGPLTQQVYSDPMVQNEVNNIFQNGGSLCIDPNTLTLDIEMERD